MDKYGAALFAATCNYGGLPTIRHDEVKWAIKEVFSALEHRRVTVEVSENSSGSCRQQAQAPTGDLGSQRVIPDRKIWATPKFLADVKDITLSRSRCLD